MWSSNTASNGSGTIELHVTFKVKTVAGTITIEGVGCISGGSVSGTRKGTKIKFGVVSGEETISYHGNISGTTMSGTYQASAGCGNDSGRWNATKD